MCGFTGAGSLVRCLAAVGEARRVGLDPGLTFGVLVPVAGPAPLSITEMS